MRTFFAGNNMADGGIVSAGSAVATLPASNLMQEWLSKVWRSQAMPTFIDADLITAQPINVVAVLGFNCLASTTTRVRIGDDPSFATSNYDSGTIVGACDPKSRQFVHIIEVAVSGQYVRVDMDDVVLNFAEAGRLFVSKGWFPEVNDSLGRAKGFSALSRRSQSRGGEVYIDEGPNLRRWTLTFENLNADEARLVSDIDRVNGTNIDVLFSNGATDANVSSETIFGLVISPTELIARTFDRSSKTYVIEERH